MISFWFIQVILLSCYLYSRIFFKRGYIYYYYYIEFNGRAIKRKIPIGYVKKDGTIINYHKPRGARKVGIVVLENGEGLVRIYTNNEKGYEEVGRVTIDGQVFGYSNPECIAIVDPDGERDYRDLWSRLHTEVPINTEKPIGHCSESGRFRKHHIQELTLLCRAAAALLLYFEVNKFTEYPPLIARTKISDTALLSSLIFSLIYVPLYYIHGINFLFPVLGIQWSYVVSMCGIFTLLWLVIDLIKRSILASSDKPIDMLMLIDRNTGLKKWNITAIFFASISLIYALLVNGYTLIPFLFSVLVGIVVNFFYYTDEYWKVLPPEHKREKVIIESWNEAGESRNYNFRLDSHLRDIRVDFNLYFKPEEIEALKSANPFNQNIDYKDIKDILHRIILNWKNEKCVKFAANNLLSVSADNSLTQFEEIQLILDMAQDPPINYTLDKESTGHEEYVRYASETLFDKTGDCDCKSALAAALFLHAGYNVIYLANFKEGHAAIAVNADKDLYKDIENVDGIIIHNGKKYYYCETTEDNWKVGAAPDFMKKINDEHYMVIEFIAN